MGVNNRHRRRMKKAQRDRRAERHPGGQAPPPRPRREGREPDYEMVRTAVLAAAESCHGDERAQSRAFERLFAVRERVGFGAVDEAVTWWVELASDRLWNEGWQPADVVRILGRKVDGGAAAAVVGRIAASATRRPEATADRRWVAQLESLRAVAPVASGGTVAWEERLGAAVRALALLLYLGPLPKLGCSSARRSPGRAGGAGAVLERVRALLAKAESTDFEEEAEAFTAKAHELMARHAIDEAMLAQAGAGEAGAEVIGWRIPVDDPYASPKSLLLHNVAKANRCHAIYSEGLGFTTAFGTEADLEIVELLFTSLLVQATEAMVRAGRSVDRSGRSRTRSFRQSFLVAFASRIGERFEAINREVVAEGEERYGREALLPVLASRSKAVEDAVHEAFPEAVARGFRVANAAGYVAGRAAAEVASLAVGEALPEPEPAGP